MNLSNMDSSGDRLKIPKDKSTPKDKISLKQCPECKEIILWSKFEGKELTPIIQQILVERAETALKK